MNKLFIGAIALITLGLTSCSVKNSASENIQKSLTSTVTFNPASFGFPSSNASKAPALLAGAEKSGAISETLPVNIKTINVQANQDGEYATTSFITETETEWKFEGIRYGNNTFNAQALQTSEPDGTWATDWLPLEVTSTFAEGFKVTKDYVGTTVFDVQAAGTNNIKIPMKALNSVLKFSVKRTNQFMDMTLRATVNSKEYDFPVPYSPVASSIILNTKDLVAGAEFKLELVFSKEGSVYNTHSLLGKNDDGSIKTKTIKEGREYKSTGDVVITDENFKAVTIIGFTWEQLIQEDITIELP